MITTAPFRRLLVERDLTISDIVQLSGLSDPTVRHFYNDELITYNTLDTICKLLKCQPKDLLRFEND